MTHSGPVTPTRRFVVHRYVVALVFPTQDTIDRAKAIYWSATDLVENWRAVWEAPYESRFHTSGSCWS